MKGDALARTEGPVGLRAFAVSLGCALPIQVIGRGAIAGALLVAFLCFLSLPGKSIYVKRTFETARGPVGLMLLLIFLFWLPNTFYSVDPIRSLEATFRTFAFVGLGTLFWAILSEQKQIHGLALQALVVATMLSVIIALIAQTTTPEIYWVLHSTGWISMPLGTSLKPFSALAVLTIPALILPQSG